MISSFCKKFAEAGKATRANEWWDSKFCPVLGVAYATAYRLDLSLAGLWPVLVFLVVSPLAAGAYANLLNDLCDLREDRLCEKPNRLAGRSLCFRTAALVAVILLGGLTAAPLASNRTLLGVYLAIWLVFTLYSVPPVRLKGRGLLGILADAAGTNVLPQMFGIYVIADWGCHTTPDSAWIVAVAVWSLARGVRGIIWHQLKDYASDQRAGVSTFVQRHSREFVKLLGERLWFPLEVAGLVAMLFLSGTALAWALLLVSLVLDAVRSWFWDASLDVVMPRKDGFRVALEEYYVLFYPPALLLASSWRNPIDLCVLAIHVLLFPAPIRSLAADVYNIVRSELVSRREKAS